MISRLLTVLIIIIFSGGLATGEIFFKNGAPHVKLSESAGIKGHTRFSRDGRPFVSFEGVPYARVRERFAASELLSNFDWEGFRNATVRGEKCAQPLLFVQKGVVGIEDCLHLSVHVPMNANPRREKYPVMIHIHGGGFGFGSGMGFRGSFFMDTDVILVSINYRLGVLGFLSTGDDVVPGNNGLKDQVQALRWVKENIAKFGGDVDNITVFGMSAGGASTHYLKLSATTKGLIHRVISQSGLAFSPFAFKPKPRREAALLAKHLNCEAQNSAEISSKEIVSCFKQLSIEKLLRASVEFKPPGRLYFAPVAETEASASSKNVPFMTKPPFEIMMVNDHPNRNVPWMAGNTENEGIAFIGMLAANDQMLKEVDAKWTEIAPRTLYYDDFLHPPDQVLVSKELKKYYFSDKPMSSETRQTLYNLYSDWFGNHGLKMAAEMAVLKGGSVYLYNFSYLGKKSPQEVFKDIPNIDKFVTHGDDVYYQEQNPEIIPGMEGIFENLKGKDAEFSRNFVLLCASFATYGKPTHQWGDTPDSAWTPVSKDEASGKKPMRYYIINSNPGFKEETFGERLKFLDLLNAKIAPEFVTQWNNQKTEL